MVESRPFETGVEADEVEFVGGGGGGSDGGGGGGGGEEGMGGVLGVHYLNGIL